MPNPTDRAIAQAFREWADPSYFIPVREFRERIYARAEQIDAAAPAGAQGAVAPFLYVCRYSEDYPWEVNAGTDVAACERCVPLYTHPQPATGDAVDAARYRWLRDPSNYESVQSMITVTNYGIDPYLLDGDELDAAIDAARGTEGA